MDRKAFLETAHDVICNQRQNVHGAPEDTFQLMADYWNVYLSKFHDTPVHLSSADVSMMMVLFKLARFQMNGAHDDNIVDGIGYMALAGELTHGTN